MNLRLFALALVSVAFSGATVAQQPAPPADTKPPSSDATCPLHHDHAKSDDHEHAKMNARGEQGMGFSQTATTHHFFLKSDGGIIQVEANDPKDITARDSIRMHLTQIAHAFSTGDFDIPMFVHDTVPPGVPEMKRLQEKITYTFEPTPNGARVLIYTSNADALAAIHHFLRFQIAEHQTKDPDTIP